MKRSYGWCPDTPDQRDYRFIDRYKSVAIPELVNLRYECPPVQDQKSLGACTGFALTSLFEFEHGKSKAKRFSGSQLFLYYNERVREGTVKSDSGAEIRTGIKSLASEGVCSLKTWPYKISKFSTKPVSKAYKEGKDHQAIVYHRLNQDLQELQTCLTYSHPFVFGFAVYESFETRKVTETGEAPIPSLTEQLLGGHAVLCVGYDNNTSRFLCRNSWGPKWGDKGYFTLPYRYLLDSDLATDFWMLETVET